MSIQVFFDPDTFAPPASSRSKGFRHLSNLRGGLVAWNEALLPVER
jgi:hypothetical protein